MTNFIKNILDCSLIPLINYIRSKYPESFKNQAYQLDMHKTLRQLSVQDAANYVQRNLESCMIFPSKKDLWRYTVSSLNAVDNKTDLYLEFGVYTGGSINYFSKNMPDISFNGFDSFIGLEEDWKGHHRPKGHFDLNGEMPKVNKNVNLHKGFFNETLPDFLQNNRQDCAFIHIDSDTYEACEYVLNQLKPQIRKGTLILFDEYFGYIGWKFGEFKAWKKFVDEHHIQYEYLAFSHDQALLRII